MTLLTLPFTANNWCQAGTTPPSLLSIDMSPTSVDVSTASAEITISLHLTDNLSGVASWSTTLYSPSGMESLTIEASPDLVSGTLLDGNFEGTGTLSQGSEEGAWSTNIVTVTDAAGNTADIDLSSYGIFLIQVGASLEDLTPPSVIDIEISPTTVDVTNSDQQVSVSAHMTDDLSGVTYGYINFRSPSGNRSTTAYLYRTSGTSLDGIFEGNATFLQYTEPGVWRPSTCYDYSVTPYREYACMYVRDRVGNYGNVDLTGTGLPLTLGVLSVPVEMNFTLVPQSSENEVNSSHTLTATVSQGGVPLQDAVMIFEIIEGPHLGITETTSTDASGVANFTYTGTIPGVDTIIASVDVEGDGEVDAARQATKTWIGVDSDGDGVTDDQDDCPNTPEGEEVDINGCSASQLDDDNDGVPNSQDQCPGPPAGEPCDSNGCSASQLDDDNDGVPNSQDQCPGTPAGEEVDAEGCPTSQQSSTCDVDGDGDIDRNDINSIFGSRGSPAAPGDPRDLDGDGLITVNDARGCVLNCTNPRCAP